MQISHNWSPNHSSRLGSKPDVICCHITDGAYNGAVAWLSGRQSGISAHFVVGKNGQVSQLVSLAEAAWCNGTQSTEPTGAKYVGRATSALVRQRGINANRYTVSIECEGNEHTHGILTTKQFAALVQLVKYIRQQVKTLYGVTISFDRAHIIGHCEITPIEKPDCPGRSFPYDRLIAAIKK